MAITFGTPHNGFTLSNGNADPYVYSGYTAESTTSGLLILSWTGYSNAGAITTTPVVLWNGVTMTKLQHVLHPSDSKEATFVHYLVAPDSGAHDFSVDLDRATGSYFRGVAITLDGVDQVTPLDGMVSGSAGSGTSKTQNVSSATDDQVMDVVCTNGGTGITPGANQVTRGSVEDAQQMNTSTTSEPGGATITMSQSWTGGNTNMYIAYNVNMAVAVDTSQGRVLLLH